LRWTAAYKSSGRPREEESAVSGDDGEEEGTRTAKGSRVVVEVGKALVPGDSAESSKKMQRLFMVMGVVIVFMFVMCNIMVMLLFCSKANPRNLVALMAEGGLVTRE
jgi:hypothetical protein